MCTMSLLTTMKQQELKIKRLQVFRYVELEWNYKLPFAPIPKKFSAKDNSVQQEMGIC